MLQDTADFMHCYKTFAAIIIPISHGSDKLPWGIQHLNFIVMHVTACQIRRFVYINN